MTSQFLSIQVQGPVFARNVTTRIIKYIGSLTELKPVKPFKILQLFVVCTLVVDLILLAHSIID